MELKTERDKLATIYSLSLFLEDKNRVVRFFPLVSEAKTNKKLKSGRDRNKIPKHKNQLLILTLFLPPKYA